jgi:hypothetical protein
MACSTDRAREVAVWRQHRPHFSAFSAIWRFAPGNSASALSGLRPDLVAAFVLEPPPALTRHAARRAAGPEELGTTNHAGQYPLLPLPMPTAPPCHDWIFSAITRLNSCIIALARFAHAAVLVFRHLLGNKRAKIHPRVAVNATDRQLN